MIYFAQCLNPDSPRYKLVKIGTTRRVYTRLRQIELENGTMQLLGICAGGYTEEARLHKQFFPYLADGREWFHRKGRLVWHIRKNTAMQIIQEPISANNVPPRPNMNKSFNIHLWDIIQRHYGDEWPPIENIADMAGVNFATFKLWLRNEAPGVHVPTADRIGVFFRLKNANELVSFGKEVEESA